MIRLETQKALSAVRDLAFCYVCSSTFGGGDITNYDHVPAQAVFASKDRQPLKLKTHSACNSDHSQIDEKIGQMIALRRGETPEPKNRKLRFRRTNLGPALDNLDVDAAIWRWITGFHAALYRIPLRLQPTGNAERPFVRSLVLPFPKGPKLTRVVEPVRVQHLKFVETIKYNRLKGNLDRIECNKGQLRYECVWDHFDRRADQWCCVFALDVYDWKDLGAIPTDVARGCAGVYMPDGGCLPAEAAEAMRSPLIIPNYDRLDPFAR
jgi:hypothetical protein